MKVRDLIKQLEQLDGDLDVTTYDHEQGEYYPINPPETITTLPPQLWGIRDDDGNLSNRSYARLPPAPWGETKPRIQIVSL